MKRRNFIKNTAVSGMALTGLAGTMAASASESKISNSKKFKPLSSKSVTEPEITSITCAVVIWIVIPVEQSPSTWSKPILTGSITT